MIDKGSWEVSSGEMEVGKDMEGKVFMYEIERHTNCTGC